MSPSSSSVSTSAHSSAQLVSAYEAWTRRREGPPPVLPPRCLSIATSAKHAGGNYSDGFGDDNKISIPCMVTLAYLTRRPSKDPNVYTCALPSGEKLLQQDQSDDVKKAKQAAARVESAQSKGNVTAAQSAMTELRQIMDRVLQECLQV